MDLEDEEWVQIPHGGLLQAHDDGGKTVFSRKYVKSPKSCFKMNYFNSQTKSVDSSSKEGSKLQKQVIPFPIQMDDDDREEKEAKEATNSPNEVKGALESDLDPIFKVFFKKDSEFVEMKMGSSGLNSRGIDLSPVETDVFQYEEMKTDDRMLNCLSSSKMTIDEQNKATKDEEPSVWKWGLNGIGTFCSLGMGVATLCIIMFGNGQRHKQQSQKIRIQVYSNDKRIKQVMNSAMRGVPLARAHITYGGYYEGL